VTGGFAALGACAEALLETPAEKRKVSTIRDFEDGMSKDLSAKEGAAQR
jgi:hypothetical protein